MSNNLNQDLFIETSMQTTFQSNDELKNTLLSIITENFQKHIDDWLYYAKPNERKVKHRLKKF